MSADREIPAGMVDLAEWVVKAIRETSAVGAAPPHLDADIVARMRAAGALGHGAFIREISAGRLTPEKARKIFGFHTDPLPFNDEWTEMLVQYLNVPADQRDVMFLVLAGEFCFIRESWRKLDAQARATRSQTPETGSPGSSPPESSRVRAGLVRAAEAFLKAVKPQTER